MGLEKAKSPFLMLKAEEYVAKRKKIFAGVDRLRDFVSGDMIYCLHCREPKVADFPEYHWVTRCCCGCEVDAWERERMGYSVAKAKSVAEVRNGDWNPFD